MRSIVDVVQLSPCRYFGVARALNSIGVLRSITVDCAFPQRLIRFFSSSIIFKRIRLDQYDISSFIGIKIRVALPAKILLFLAGFFKSTSLIRLVFYLSSQFLVQAAYLFFNLFTQPSESCSRIVFCYDTGAFLIVAYKMLFRKKFLIYIEQCVSPRVSQAMALQSYAQKRIPFNVKLYYKIMSIVEGFEHAHADHIICPSSVVRKQLNQQGIPLSRVTMIPYSFEPPSDYVCLPPHSLDDAKVRFKILFVGNDLLRKGFITLLASLEPLHTYDFEIHAAGNFTVDDIKKATDSPMLNRCIVYGKLNRKNLYQLYQSCNIFVSPSFCEGSPITILEAAFFNNQIIASYESGCNFKPYTEFLPFEAGNTKALTLHIKSCFDRPDSFIAMARRSKEALVRFSAEAYRDKIRNTLTT